MKDRERGTFTRRGIGSVETLGVVIKILRVEQLAICVVSQREVKIILVLILEIDGDCHEGRGRGQGPGRDHMIKKEISQELPGH